MGLPEGAWGWDLEVPDAAAHTERANRIGPVRDSKAPPRTIIIKAASSDERALAGRTCRAVAQPGFGTVGLRNHLLFAFHDGESDFLCPVGGAMDMTQVLCTDICRAPLSAFLRDLAQTGHSMVKLQGLPGEGFKWTAPPRPAVTSGCGTVRLCAHPLLSCHAGVKTSSKRLVNQMMFVRLPVSSRWRYGNDTVLMHRSIRGDSLYIPARFGGF